MTAIGLLVLEGNEADVGHKKMTADNVIGAKARKKGLAVLIVHVEETNVKNVNKVKEAKIGLVCALILLSRGNFISNFVDDTINMKNWDVEDKKEIR